MSKFRVGHGYDVHAFTDGDGIVLGGVAIDCDRAVLAHSDGDVLIHALCDALLGAMGHGDIGHLFPDNDPVNRGRDSREFLRHVSNLLTAEGYRLGNVDLTVIAQVPRIAPHVPAMRESLARDLDCDGSRINVKATTTERLGFVGREEGLAAAAVVLIERT